MSVAARRWLFLPAAAILGAFYLWGLHGIPPLGQYRGPYGDIINAVAVSERHVTNAVSAVNFDYRGFDTMGEEFILFAAVVGSVVLLRQLRDEEKEELKDVKPQRSAPAPSDAVRVLTLGLVGPTVLFGIYIVAHGQLTPGGGFQGGVILATAPLLVYLAGDFKIFKQISSHFLIEVAEACGIGGYAVVGLVGLISGRAFLENILPLGQAGEINSGGTVLLLNLLIGLAVSAGFVLLLWAFLEQTLELKRKEKE